MQILERKKLGQVLCEKSWLDDNRLGLALEQQEKDGGKLGQILLDLGYITTSQLYEALSIQAGIEKAKLEDISIPKEILDMVPSELVSKYNLLPIAKGNGKLEVAMANPFQVKAIEDLRIVTGCPIKRYYGNSKDLEQAILKFYGSNVARMLENLAPKESKLSVATDDEELSPTKLHELARQPSLVNLVNLILLEAIGSKASDVHIEPFEHQVSIKYRVDGMLVQKSPSPKRLQAAIVSRIKIMANMDIAERFVPQDGHIEFVGDKGKVDIRVSTVPTIYGESITMRILDRSNALIGLEELGMSSGTLGGFEKCLTKTHGIVLVTGPTGSGKSTTLYAALNHIFTPGKKIITIEDPVEYQLEGIIQMPVNPRRGLTFARGLRHILRQDPDIVMVGEIRDKETAEIAIRAALNGHLVFSTLHTNDAAGAVTRLIDMGIEPFLLASSLEGVLAQRLIRTVCSFCKTRYTPDAHLLASLNNSITLEPDGEYYYGTGCNECSNSGMKGRTGIYELLRVTDSLRKMISARPTTEDIVRAAPPDHISMRHDGITKILNGITTPEEVLRVTQSIEE